MSLAPNEIFESTTERYLAYLQHKSGVQAAGANSWNFATFCEQMLPKHYTKHRAVFTHHPDTGFFGFFSHGTGCELCNGDCDE